jgi:hypothetical protein
MDAMKHLAPSPVNGQLRFRTQQLSGSGIVVLDADIGVYHEGWKRDSIKNGTQILPMLQFILPGLHII